MAATAQAQAEATKEAQKAGIEHAKAKEDRYLGRKPSYTRWQVKTVLNLKSQGKGDSAIAKETGLSRQTVIRIRTKPADAEKVLALWEGRRRA